MNSQSVLNEQYQKEIDKYKSQCQQLEQELDKSIKLGANKYTAEELDKYKKQINDLQPYKVQSTELQQKNQKLSSIKNELEDEISQLKTIVDEYKEEKQGKHKTYNSQVLNLKKQMLLLRKERDEIKQNKDDITDKLSKAESLQSQYETEKQQEHEKMLEMLEEIKKENLRLKSQLEQHNDADDETSTIEESNDNNPFKINNDIIISTLREQVLTLQSKLDEYEQKQTDDLPDLPNQKRDSLEVPLTDQQRKIKELEEKKQEEIKKQIEEEEKRKQEEIDANYKELNELHSAEKNVT